MSYSVNPTAFRSIFAVPSDIVDKHIRLANGHQLKVLLWILRNSPDKPDLNEMCKALKITIDDATDYLQYWVENGILSGKDDTYAETEIVEIKPEVSKANTPSPIFNATTVEDTTPSKPSSAEILTRLDESPEIGHLFNEAQIKLGKTIGYDGQCTLLLIHDHYGLPTEVIFMMIDYCASIGKTNYSYIQAVGKDWGLREIDTIEKAAEHIEALRNTQTLWTELSRATDITNKRPTPKQMDIVRRWSEEFEFKIDMVLRAYETMVENTGKFNLNYMNKVLTNWYEKGYKTPDDINNAEIEFQKAKNSKTSNDKNASYDLDKFKEQSLHSELKYERKKKK